MEGARLLKRDDVVAYTQITVPTIYYLMDQGRFPRPIRVGKRSVRWVREEIDQWVNERTQERDLETQ